MAHEGRLAWLGQLGEDRVDSQRIGAPKWLGMSAGYLGSLCCTHAKGYWSGADAKSRQRSMFGIILENRVLGIFARTCKMWRKKEEGISWISPVSWSMTFEGWIKGHRPLISCHISHSLLFLTHLWIQKWRQLKMEAENKSNAWKSGSREAPTAPGHSSGDG